MADSTISFSSSSNRHFWKSSSTWKPLLFNSCRYLRRDRQDRLDLPQGPEHVVQKLPGQELPQHSPSHKVTLLTLQGSGVHPSTRTAAELPGQRG